MALEIKGIEEYLAYDGPTGTFTWKRQCGPSSKGSCAGTRRKDGYLLIGFKGKMLLGHRIAWFITYGEWPNSSIDHIDGNPSNNKISNLRLATHNRNIANQKLHNKNAYGTRGIRKTRSGKYSARIGSNYEQIHLGTFSTLDEAKEARDTASRHYFGKFARIDQCP